MKKRWQIRKIYKHKAACLSIYLKKKQGAIIFFQYPNETSAEWKSIFGTLETICAAVLDDGPENGLSDLCNGLDSGDIEENDNKKYNRAFKALDPVCEDLLEDEEEEENAVETKAKNV
jgi:hypothetical protein